MKATSLGELALALVLMLIVVLAPIMPAVQAQDKVPIRDATVVIIENGNPIAANVLANSGSPYHLEKMINATGKLFSQSVPYTATDSEGRFDFDIPLKNGSYNITANAPGYVFSSSDTARFVIGDSSMTVQKDLILSMQPSAIVSGRVVDEFDNPISGVVVTVGDPYNGANYDVTMGDGVFVLDTNLGTGTYSVHAFKPDSDFAALQSVAAEMENSVGMAAFDSLWKVPMYSGKKDSGGWVSTESQVTLEQGKLSTIEIRMEKSRSISGKISDSGNPVEGLAVFAFGSNGRLANTVGVTDANGAYLLENDLTPGVYTVVVPWPFNKGYIPSAKEVTVPSNSSSSVQADFALVKSETISGRVVDANGNGVVNATVFAISAKLIEQENMAGFLVEGITVDRTDNDGNYVLNGTVGNGTYTVSASFGNIAPAQSMVKVDVAKSGNSTTAKDIVLDFKDVVTISGNVTDADGEPIEGASIVPSLTGGFSAGSDVRTGSEGRFAINIPIKDSKTVNHLNVTVSADGYVPLKVDVDAVDDGNIVLEKARPVKITGTVVAEDYTSQFIETVLKRKGSVSFGYSNDQYDIGIETNSRILEANFDQPSKRITIQIEGVHNSGGMCKVAIPKEFLGGPFGVLLDGVAMSTDSYTVSENQTHSFIDVRYHHSQHEITIQGTTVVPEFPLPVVLVATIFAALVIVNRIKIRIPFE